MFEQDIEMRNKTVGRLIDPAMPVQMSGGLYKIARQLDSGEPALRGFENRLQDLEAEAEFGTGDGYESVGRMALKLSKEIIERTRLHLHAHLWMLWTLEGVSQASQIHSVMTEYETHSDMPEGAFEYLAHPPIIVSTMACTAMIEEVGAVYINKETDYSVDYDGTRCSEVLRKLEKGYSRSENHDFEVISESLIPKRTDFAHYMRRRQSGMGEAELIEHTEAAMETLKLIRALVTDLLSDKLNEHFEEVRKPMIDCCIGDLQ